MTTPTTAQDERAARLSGMVLYWREQIATNGATGQVAEEILTELEKIAALAPPTSRAEPQVRAALVALIAKWRTDADYYTTATHHFKDPGSLRGCANDLEAALASPADAPETQAKLDALGTAFAQSFDARDWAASFVAHVALRPTIATDEDCMVGWFANAIMRGYDERARRVQTPAPADAPSTPAMTGSNRRANDVARAINRVLEAEGVDVRMDVIAQIVGIVEAALASPADAPCRECKGTGLSRLYPNEREQPCFRCRRSAWITSEITKRLDGFTKASCDECDDCGKVAMCSYHSLLSELDELRMSKVPADALSQEEWDGLGLSIDMTDADRLRGWAHNLLVHGGDVSHWGSVTFLASKMQIIATGIEKAVRDIGKLRRLRPVVLGERNEQQNDEARVGTMGNSTHSPTAPTD